MILDDYSLQAISCMISTNQRQVFCHMSLFWTNERTGFDGKLQPKAPPFRIFKFKLGLTMQLFKIQSNKLLQIMYHCSLFDVYYYYYYTSIQHFFIFVRPECTFLMITLTLWFYYLCLTWVHFPNDNTHIVILLSLSGMSALS